MDQAEGVVEVDVKVVTPKIRRMSLWKDLSAMRTIQVRKIPLPLVNPRKVFNRLLLYPSPSKRRRRRKRRKLVTRFPKPPPTVLRMEAESRRRFLPMRTPWNGKMMGLILILLCCLTMAILWLPLPHKHDCEPRFIIPLSCGLAVMTNLPISPPNNNNIDRIHTKSDRPSLL